MLFYPAVDLKDSKCVRLYKGQMDQSTVFSSDPLAQVQKFSDAGCSWVHVVDLSNAVDSKNVHFELIKDIVANANVSIQLGGGIRDIATIEKWLGLGVSRVVIGTLALNNPSLLKDIAKNFGEKVAVAVDVKDGFVAVKGWTEVSTVTPLDFLFCVEDAGIRTVIYTDISKDGTLEGPDFDGIGKITANTSLHVIASGGISSLDDLKNLKNRCADIVGVISGRALYEKKISVEDAVQIVQA